MRIYIKKIFLSTCLAMFFSMDILAASGVTVPLGLPPIPWPSDNPYYPKKAELGRLLFFDKRLSAVGTISCATCHAIPKAFADPNVISIGIMGHHGTRHAPTVINTAYLRLLFWDGRANSLEEQCLGPLSNNKEMADYDSIQKAHMECQERICKIEGYRVLFKDAFNDEECTLENIVKAVATFERTILSGNSPYDRYKAGDKTAMSQEQIEGLKVFNHAGCSNCHAGFNFTDQRFLNIGVGMDKPNPDLGRYNITKKDKDWGSFKVPTLRDVEHTPPYMHDGSLKTLEEVVDYYDKGGIPNKNLHPLMKPLNLTDQQKKDLVSFMKALSGEGWHHVKVPSEFPQ